MQCWGDNTVGELGNDAGLSGSNAPVTVAGITNAVAVDAGAFHSCALLDGGSVQCWGYTGIGALEEHMGRFSVMPVTVAGITNATAVDVGHTHSCALLGSGSMKCWGSNINGELGNGTTLRSFAPVIVSALLTPRPFRQAPIGVAPCCSRVR